MQDTWLLPGTSKELDTCSTMDTWITVDTPGCDNTWTWRRTHEDDTCAQESTCLDSVDTLGGNTLWTLESVWRRWDTCAPESTCPDVELLWVEYTCAWGSRIGERQVPHCCVCFLLY